MSLLNSWDGNNFKTPGIMPRLFNFSPSASTEAPSLDITPPSLDITPPDIDIDPATGATGLQGEAPKGGISPGRTVGMQLASMIAPGPLGMGLGLANTALGVGAQSFNQSVAGLDRSLADAFGESLGLTGHPGGVGGYGSAGRGGYTGAMDYADPGVAGAARGMASSAVNTAISAAGGAGASKDGENIGDADADHDSQQADLSDPDADVSAPDTQDDGAGGGDGGGDGGSVICTELHRQGLINDATYNADSAFGRTLPDYVINGYHLWAKPVVRVMRRSRFATRVVRTLALPFIRDMVAVTEGRPRTRRLRAGIFVCGAIGMNEARAIGY